MTALQKKIAQLDASKQETVSRYIDALLAQAGQQPPATTARQAFLRVSQWSEEDVVPILNAMKSWQNWKPEEW